MTARRRWLRWVIAGAVLLGVLAVAVPYLYIHVVEDPTPAPLGLRSRPAATTTDPRGSVSATASLSGRWKVGAGSVVGYRVTEVLLGQSNVAVGRSRSVTGQLLIRGTTVTSAGFAVPVASIHSDQSQRDVQFDGRIMDVSAYPTATFTLTRPISLAQLPAPGVVKQYQVTGQLTLHGHTRQVTFAVSAERTGSLIKISGSIPVVFAEWKIPNPSFGSFVTTQDHGILEFLLVLAKA